VRIGEALGLRHQDLAVAERALTVTPRRNDNQARTKSTAPRTVPVSAELMRLYARYLHVEYGGLDSDYVFVNLWGQPLGHPLAYQSVYDLVVRLRRRTGLDFDPHWFRHTYATELLRRGTPIETVSKLLGHASITTTIDTYGHLTPQDARRALEAVVGLPAGRCACEPTASSEPRNHRTRRPQRAAAASAVAAAGAAGGGGAARVPR
jgi:integrase/recombinase XerD